MTKARFLLKQAERADRSSGCWIPPIKPNNLGYVQVRFAGKLVMLHRLAYEAWHGRELPAWPVETVHHTCDNRACFNPRHLRGGIKKRHPAAKLTVDDVKAIRAKLDLGEGPAAIAKELNVSVSAVRSIINGRTWAWVP